MLRRLNYTNRIRLRRSDVSVCLQNTQDGLEFDARISLDRYKLPANSRVYVEAYRQTNWMRFGFGQVGAIKAPADRKLGQFDGPEGIQFRVKVIADAGVRRLLAEADGIPLRLPNEEETNRKPLLPVKPADMPDEIFRLDFQGDSPLLLISKQAGAYGEITHSPVFVALAFPMILRQILVRVLIVDGFDDPSQTDDWRSAWLKFATSLPSVPELPTADDEAELKFEWIDSAAAAFGKQIKAQERFHEYWTAL
jgi:hypothetical protein